jgi:Flp pilus assembly protein CpaB
MKFKTVLLLVIAVILGTAASRISKRLLSSPPPDAEPVAESISVFVAKKPIRAGTVLREPDRVLEERTLIKNDAPAGTISRLFQLRDRRLTKDIEANAIITADYLADDEVANIELLKKEGRQAVAVQVQSLGNYLFLPKSRVDFIWTAPAGAIPESRVIAQDLPLLGVQTKDGGAAIVTVAAKRDDADKLLQAATQGTLKLVLRKN